MGTVAALCPHTGCTERPCPSTYTIPGTARWVRCYKPRGHEGDHQAVIDYEVISWPNG
jgi:hypothetical protein